jgi:serine/threonine protein kinase/tetratricopeptide (TPR) repeat protein
MFHCGRVLLLVYYLPAMPTAERYHQYEILRREDGSLWELGRGAMGITYKAQDTNLRFTVALKVINSAFLENDTARQRFLREARAAAALRHSNIASVFNLGTEQDNFYYVMEFVDGETLEARVRRQGPLEPAQALNIALQVARALAVAAKQQLVHRDLKPSNLMLVEQEGESIVKVIDFGLAKVAKEGGEDSSTLTMGGFVGTPHFASPEQVEEGEVDIRSDIYSLGATLYFVLTGQSPFSGSVGQVMSQHLYKPVPMEPLARLPRSVASLLQQMMEKDRHKRPQTPQDLQKAILACLEEIRLLPRESIHKTPETTSAFETLDLSSTSGQPLAPGVMLAQNYQLIEELVESPPGRKFLADDLRRKRRVSLLILSPEFLSDADRLRCLEEAVQLLRNAPHRMLREIYSLETVADGTFLVEEYFIGPSLLDVLRARSVLSAPEVVRLLSLLAPLADFASGHQLQHVDLTLAGVYLAFESSTGRGAQPDLLLRPLTTWEPLEVKVNAIDFSFLPSDILAARDGSVTRIQGVAHNGPRGSCVQLLGLLAYELLGGPRSRLESTGQYTPIAALTQEGNAALRRALADECSSAGELIGQLAAAVGVRGPAASVSATAKPFTPEPLPQIPPPKAEVPIKRRSKINAWTWVLATGVIVSLGIVGSYSIYRSWRPPTAPRAVFDATAPPKISLKLEQSPTQELAALSVQIEPPGATILLDGTPPQAPPDTFTHLSFGHHQLTATSDDYEPLKQDIEVRRGMTPQIHLQLKPRQEITALSVQSEPAGAAILLDGKPPQAPANTFTNVPFGSHQFTATLDNYEPLQQDIEVRRGMTPRIDLQLKPRQQITALSVQSEPAGATILLDGKPPQAPANTFTDVPFGTHQLIATLDGYETLKQEVEVRQGMTPEMHLQLTPSQEIAALSVKTEPPGASVLLDGSPPQTPPSTFTHVPFGTHQLIATLKKYEPTKLDLQVHAGMTPEIKVNLKQSPTDPIAWILSLDPGQLAEAGKNFSETLQIYNELAIKHPETYRPYVAMTLNTLAILDGRQGRMEEARKKFAEALAIYTDLAVKHPEIYRSDVATALNNLGNVDLDQGRMEVARKEFSETLQIRRELAEKNAEIYRPFVARTLNNLAILDRRQDRIEEARKEFSEALLTYRELAQKNPDTYRPFLATMLNNLGNVDLSQGRLEEAHKEFAEALQIYEILAQQDPKFMPNVERLKKLLEQSSGAQ